MRRRRQLRHHPAAAVDGGDGGVARQRHAQAPRPCWPSMMAVPIVLQVPGERLIACSASRKSSCVISPGLDVLGHLPQRRAGPHPFAPEPAVQHRPAGDDDGGQVDRGRTHQQRRRGLVAADQQHHAVDRIGADRFLDIHCGQGCGTSSRWGAARFRRARTPGIPAESRRPRRSRASPVSARSRRWALQGVSSDQVLQMPITGRPSNKSAGKPWFFIQDAVIDVVAAVAAEPFGRAQFSRPLGRLKGHLNLNYKDGAGVSPAFACCRRRRSQRRAAPDP